MEAISLVAAQRICYGRCGRRNVRSDVRRDSKRSEAPESIDGEVEQSKTGGRAAGDDMGCPGKWRRLGAEVSALIQLRVAAKLPLV